MKQAYFRRGVMNKNRYILCLLLCALLVYYALPRLPVHRSGIEGTFAVAWLFLAFVAVAGNLSAILYTPKNRKKSAQAIPSKRIIRSYNG